MVQVEFLRQNGNKTRTQFSVPGPIGSCFDVRVSLHEPLKGRPTLVLACAEIKNHFAKVKGTVKINLMTITEQEDFNVGKYGYQATLKALIQQGSLRVHALGGRPGTDSMSPKEERHCARSSRRRPFSGNCSMLLLKSCTSANIAVPSWGCQRVVLIKRMLDLMSGTDCRHFHVHGCMYGVVEQYGVGRAIKKPLSFLSWNLGKPKDLELKCAGSHEHAPCANRTLFSVSLPPARRVLHAWVQDISEM